MREAMRAWRSVVALAALVAAGCGKDDGGGMAPPATNPVPDFAWTDVNPTSASYGATVSPRDYLGQVSAWYFGHAT